MKSYVVVLFLLVSGLVQAQTRPNLKVDVFPGNVSIPVSGTVSAVVQGTANVNITNATLPVSGTVTATIPTAVNINGHSISLLQLAAEGRLQENSSPAPSFTANSPSSATINHGFNQTIQSSGVAVGRALFLTTASFTISSGPSYLYAAAIQNKLTALYSVSQGSTGHKMVFGANGGQVTIQPNILVGSEGTINCVATWLGANNAPMYYVGASWTGIEFTDDLNFDAKKVIMVVGESTAWGTMGNDPSGVAYPKDSLWTFQLVNALRAEGKSVRHINKAFGGATSQHIAYAQRSGYLDVKYDLLIYNAIHNDKTVNTSQATYQKNLADIIAQRNKNQPGASILFVSDFPQEAVNDSRNATYRAWMQQVATDPIFGGGTANRVYYVDASNAFALGATAATDLNFTERTTNTRLHPSGLGHGIIFRTKIWPAVKLTDFYLNTKWNGLNDWQLWILLSLLLGGYCRRKQQAKSAAIDPSKRGNKRRSQTALGYRTTIGIPYPQSIHQWRLGLHKVTKKSMGSVSYS